jgi:hypothetical protein
MARSLESSMQKVVKHKVLSSLVDEDDTREYYRKMFEEDEWLPAERTVITSVPPADVRIHNFQRK